MAIDGSWSIFDAGAADRNLSIVIALNTLGEGSGKRHGDEALEKEGVMSCAKC